MRNTYQRSVNSARLVFGTSLILIVSATGVLAARALPDTLFGWAAGVAIGLVLLPVLASPIEWLVHRYIYHRVLIRVLRPIYEVHHRAHHHIFFPTWRYVTGGPPRRLPILGTDRSRIHTTAGGNAFVRLAHWMFYMAFGVLFLWPLLWILTRSVPLMIGVIIASAVVSDLFISVHDAIHRPGSHRLMERQFWFKFLDEHHYIHHVDTEANVNFLLPLSDALFGTLRRELTSDEIVRHGTREQAKAHPVGAGEPAYETDAARLRHRAPASVSRAI
jgi:hypothetical protein